MACAPCPSTRLSAASPTAPPSPPIYAASGPSSTSHERSEVGCRWGLDAACGICTLRVFAPEQKKAHNFLLRSKKKRTKRHVAHRASPRHCHARARCSAPSTRARACRARLSRTHHACAPRQRRTCSHIATRACTSCQKARCVLDVTGHWQIVGRPAADTSGMHTHCIALAIAAARDPHALPTRCACHPPPTLSPYAER